MLTPEVRKAPSRNVVQRGHMRPATPGECADAVTAAGGAHLHVGRLHVGNRRTDGWAPMHKVTTLPVDTPVSTRRPHRDMSSRGRDPLPKAPVCPGCGIVPPTGRKCAQCWD